MRWGLVEADFQRYYGMDLRVAVTTETPRRLYVLLNGLPVEAAVWREDVPGWTSQDEMAALQVETLDRWMYALWATLIARWSTKRPDRYIPLRFNHPDRPTVEDAREANKGSVAGTMKIFGKIS